MDPRLRTYALGELNKMSRLLSLLFKTLILFLWEVNIHFEMIRLILKDTICQNIDKNVTYYWSTNILF